MEKQHIILIIVVLVLILAGVFANMRLSGASHVADNLAEDLLPYDGVVDDRFLPVLLGGADTDPLGYESEEKAPSEAVYEITLESNWSEALQPEWYPSGAHLSPFVAWSHSLSGRHSVFREGTISTVGFEDMAETGATGQLLDEIEKLQSQDLVRDVQTGKVIFVPGTSRVMVKVSKDSPFITGVSMIAPSPDWFIAFQDFEMLRDGEWVDEISTSASGFVIDVFDAGTDSGDTFTASDEDTQPREVISRLHGIPSEPIANFIIRRVE